MVRFTAKLAASLFVLLASGCASEQKFSAPVPYILIDKDHNAYATFNSETDKKSGVIKDTFSFSFIDKKTDQKQVVKMFDSVAEAYRICADKETGAVKYKVVSFVHMPADKGYAHILGGECVKVRR